jgi:hypothetical protein
MHKTMTEGDRKKEKIRNISMLTSEIRCIYYRGYLVWNKARGWLRSANRRMGEEVLLVVDCFKAYFRLETRLEQGQGAN